MGQRHCKLLYGASKGGVILLTKVLAIELMQHEITVNAVAPTFVEATKYKAA